MMWRFTEQLEQLKRNNNVVPYNIMTTAEIG